ncbi:MAG: thiol peroxidase [Planctomycetota bacterium]|nr:MAG: thiol peroxidase [Planctomycetota bacterium]
MASITLKGNPIRTSGELPAAGAVAPNFQLVRQDLSELELTGVSGKKVLNIFPSIDTPICAISVRRFNQVAGSAEGVSVLNISADLPFAAKRFCGAEGLEGVETLSCYRSHFADDYGVRMVDGPLAGLCARAVLVLDEKNQVIHAELVPEIAQEPDYDGALQALGLSVGA